MERMERTHWLTFGLSFYTRLWQIAPPPDTPPGASGRLCRSYVRCPVELICPLGPEVRNAAQTATQGPGHLSCPARAAPAVLSVVWLHLFVTRFARADFQAEEFSRSGRPK